MKIALYDIDSKIPNLALMKLSAWHKSQGDDVEFYAPQHTTYDKVYASKVFTYTETTPYLINDIMETGGSGLDIEKKLPDHIEHICPDYDLYNTDYSIGFLTRGCIRECPWCIVPKKEGSLYTNADIDEFLRHKHVLLLDNNVLASSHGVDQIRKIAKMGVRVDFNQGLDARLIDNEVARLLSSVKWWRPIRLACDSLSMIEPVRKAVTLLRWHNARPTRYMAYVLIKDIDSALAIIRFLKGMNVDPFAQPYRDRLGTDPTQDQKDLARWCNHKAIFKTCTFEDYKSKGE